MFFFGRDSVVDFVSRVCFVLVAVHTRHWLVVVHAQDCVSWSLVCRLVKM